MFLKWSLCVLIIYLKLMSVRCAKTSSLTFVIDDTYSMTDEIQQVRDAAVDITELVKTEKATEIKDLVLVTFNDADIKIDYPTWEVVRLRIKTTEKDPFLKVLNALRVIDAYNMEFYRNGECPEYSLTGLTKGLEESALGSYVFVFTDADAKDYKLVDNVINLSQKRQSQVIFIITYDYSCNYPKSEGYQVYHKIAKASNGIVFRLAKNEVKYIMDSIKLLISGQKSVVTSQVVQSNGAWKRVPFAVDDQTEYVMISTSGKNVDLEVEDDNNKFSIDHVMWQSSGKVVKFYAPRPNTYYARVKAQTDVSIVVYSRTDFSFTHGFSVLIPKSMDDTSKQPIKGKEHYLSVLVEDPNNAVEVKKATILDMNDKVIIANLPLRKITNTGNHYITEKFVSPNEMFKIQVSGINKNTGGNIKRFAKTNINPQDPPKPDSKAPTVSIAEGTAVDVEYDGEVTLTCRVSAYPEPLITWVSADGSQYKPPSALVEEPYEHISYLKLSHLKKSNTYFCKARNPLRENQSEININVLSPFKTHSIPNDTTKTKFGKETQIVCDVRSKFPLNIKWKLPSKSIKHKLSADNKVLTINAADLNAQGQYSCETTLISDPTQTVTATTTLKITDLAVPEARAIMKTVIAIKGTSAVAGCRITGVPKPSVLWEFKAENSSTFEALSTIDDEVHFSNTGYDAAGTYKCTATSTLGFSSDSDTIHLIVHGKPEITTKKSLYSGVKGDKELKIPCDATGVPEPTIIWTQGKKVINSGPKIVTTKNELIIINPNENDSGKFTCVAKNTYGNKTQKFDVLISAAPEVHADQKTVTVMKGESNYVSCRITGTPKPEVSWAFKAKDSPTFVSLLSKDAQLSLTNIGYDAAGTYKCTATNTLGSSNDTIELNVHGKPEITTKKSLYFGVKGDKELKIPCNATGVPEPTIIWTQGGKVINSGPKIVTTKNELIIINPNENDSGKFTCEAKNKYGNVTHKFDVLISAAPEVHADQKTVTVMKGESNYVSCRITGAPKPEVSWAFKAKDSPTFVSLLSKDAQLSLTNIGYDAAGTYKCTATNTLGSSNDTIELNVHGKPEIVNPKSVYTGIIGDKVLQVPCLVTGVPKPTVVWKHEGKPLRSDAKIQINNNVLVIKNPNENDTNEFTCEANNKYDGAEKKFNIEISEFSNIDGEHNKSRYIYLKKGESTDKIICDLPNSGPSSIRWYVNSQLSVEHQPIYRLQNATFSNDGNYTCRVNTEQGSTSLNYVVDVGFAPTFQMDEQSPVFWNGNKYSLLNCNVNAKPREKVSWFYNGQEVYSKYTELSILGWGSYSCDVSNEHGSVRRSFNVTSTGCNINRTAISEEQNSPLLMDENNVSWPQLSLEGEFYSLKKNQKINLQCGTTNQLNNVFKTHPKMTAITAQCILEDKFLVDGKSYRFNDLQCQESVRPSFEPTKKQCLKEGELINVGFRIDSRFLSAYEVCYDKDKRRVLYSKVLMSSSNAEPEHAVSKSDVTCGYSARRLVRPQHVARGPPQRAIASQQYNSMPVIDLCNSTRNSWNDLEKAVLTSFEFMNTFTMWTGGSQFDGSGTPRYLWKVLQYEDLSMEAVVFVNAQNANNADIKCPNNSGEVLGDWDYSDPYTYQCKIDDFFKAFELSKEDLI